jgi:hypothetical protein
MVSKGQDWDQDFRRVNVKKSFVFQGQVVCVQGSMGQDSKAAVVMVAKMASSFGKSTFTVGGVRVVLVASRLVLEALACFLPVAFYINGQFFWQVDLGGVLNHALPSSFQ